MDFAKQHIPRGKHKETSLFIFATAGMRMLAQPQSEAILKVLRENLPKLYEFIILDQHIEIISGKWEGIYSWIAVNYALGKFGSAKKFSSSTSAAVDGDFMTIFDSSRNIRLNFSLFFVYPLKFRTGSPTPREFFQNFCEI